MVQYLGELGADVHVIRNDELSVAEIEALNPERIVVSPAPAPHRSGVSLEVIKHFAGKLPILGVCLGHQSIGQPSAVMWCARARPCTARPAPCSMRTRACSKG